MKQFEERRKLKRILFSRPVFFLLLILALSITPSLYKIYKKSRQAVLISNQIEEEMKLVEGRKGKLEASVEEIKTEAGQEKELRKKFQVKRVGEDYVVLLGEEELQTGKGGGESKNWLDKFFDFFK